jgi:hypothetical protein
MSVEENFCTAANTMYSLLRGSVLGISFFIMQCFVLWDSVVVGLANHFYCHSFALLRPQQPIHKRWQ